MVTTHFTEIKNFAERTPGFENARMEFDAETLEPLYRLRIGEAGHSYAFVIAAKLGIPEAIIARSREITEAGISSGNTAVVHRESRDPVGLEESSSPELPVLPPAKPNELTDAKASEDEASSSSPFHLGDRVYVPYLKRSGTVYETIDARGNVGVLIQKDRMRINHKRLKPYIAAEDLYPDDYDLDIVFESKENRKKRSIMKRKHIEGLEIEKSPSDSHFVMADQPSEAYPEPRIVRTGSRAHDVQNFRVGVASDHRKR